MADRLFDWLCRMICRIKGHDWSKCETFNKTSWRICHRCGLQDTWLINA